jgi:hypothetical protein
VGDSACTGFPGQQFADNAINVSGISKTGCFILKLSIFPGSLVE